MFGYSDEDGTEAQTLPDKVAPEEIEERFARISSLVEELTAQRAEERWGERVVVLVEEIDQDGTPLGRAAHQGPDVDGICQLIGDIEDATPGRLVRGEVVGSEGADLVVELS